MFAARPEPRSQPRIVVAHGWGGSPLPVAAAALAGATDAPLLLTDVDGGCDAGSPARSEVRRLAAPGAEILIVAPDGLVGTAACTASLRALGVSVTRLADPAAVATALAAARSVTEVLVVRGPLADGNLPEA